MDEASRAMDEIMEGRAQPAQIAGLLIGLSMKGERPAEIVGLARTMRARATPLSRRHAPVFDTCGTGGDRAHTFNVSTVAALVLAACGVRVAKHGNRSVSSRCGSADLFEALGVQIAADAGRRRALPRGSRNRVLLCADVSSVDAARRADAKGAGRADGLQPARTADQSRPAPPAAGRRAAAGADRARRAIARAARIGTRLGRARRGWPRRDLDHRIHQGVGVPRRRGQHVLRASRRISACPRRRRRARRRRCRGQRGDRPARARRRDAVRRATSCY